MTHYEIISKLIGPTEPLGDAARDAKRLANLEEKIMLVDRLLADLRAAAKHDGSSESSADRIGSRAARYIEHYASKGVSEILF